MSSRGCWTCHARRNILDRGDRMRELGDRFEMNEQGEYVGFYILEVSRYEFDLIEKLLEEHNTPQEERELNQWRADFHKEFDKLTLKGRTANTLMRGPWPDGYRDHEGRLLNFEQWADRVLESYATYDKKGRLYPPLESVRNLGAISYMELIKALQEQR
jgi:hypothetical protein